MSIPASLGADGVTALDRFLGRWAVESTHPSTGDRVIPGIAELGPGPGGAFVLYRVRNDDAAFPDSLGVVGVMEGDATPSMQYFDERGVHRRYEVEIDGRVLRLVRDVPGFRQRVDLVLDADGDAIRGVWQLDEGSGFRDDLAVHYRRIRG